VLSVDGTFDRRPDVAIVVFGEDPYAEFVGDRPTLEFSPSDKKDLALMRRLREAGIPVVAVFLSGRPMWVNPELNASNAFVAAFLPGSEGGGVADLLFRAPDGSIRHDFRGRLSYSWPKRADQTPLNRGDPGYDPLFPYGHGLSYGQDGELPVLSEERPAGASAGTDGVFFGRGGLPAGWSLSLVDEGGPAQLVTGPAAATPTGRLKVSGVDRRAQEDARAFTWDGSGGATVRIAAAQPLDLSREVTGELNLSIDYRVDSPPTAPVMLGMDCGIDCGVAVPIAGLLRTAPAGEWRTMLVPLRCFAEKGADMTRVTAPFFLTTPGQLSLAISDVRLATGVRQERCGAS
jgi:beta-glucosidase